MDIPNLNKILCLLGFHDWKNSRERRSFDMFSPVFADYDPLKRICERCGKEQIFRNGKWEEYK